MKKLPPWLSKQMDDIAMEKQLRFDQETSGIVANLTREGFLACAELLLPLLLEAKECASFYGVPDEVLSGSDYQMYGTSSSREAFDDGGEVAREFTKKLEVLGL